MILLTIAGHGGPDSGALNPFNSWLPEKTINLNIANEITRIAAMNGHEAYAMRTTDIDFALNDIAPTARELGAQVVVEVHCDAGDIYSTGCHAICLPNTQSVILGEHICSKIERTVGIPNNGVKDHFWSNRQPVYVRNVARFQQLVDRCHLLVESGFITGEHDEPILASRQTEIAWSYVSAMHSMFGFKEPVMFQDNAQASDGLLKAFITIVGGGAVIYGLSQYGKSGSVAK